MKKWERIEGRIISNMGKDGSRITESRENIEIARKACAEGMILLKNEKRALPVKKGEGVALFGIDSADYIKGGEGSGNVVTRYVIQPVDAFEKAAEEGLIKVYKPLHNFYRASAKQQHDNGHRTGYTFEPEITDSLIEDAKGECSTAMIFIGRISTENDDVTQRDYCLSCTEKNLIDKVSSAFSKTVIILNTCSVLDLSYVANNSKINSIVAAFQGGNDGADVLKDMLLGKICPSGKTTDTWAREYMDYPSSPFFNKSRFDIEYCEDIYVGYRYFETIPGAKEKVLYPFGFGLSYTTFSIDYKFEKHEKFFKVTANVKNTGKMSGKETVQIYTKSPVIKLEKPEKELRAFKKTPLLESGKECTLEFEIRFDELASYDSEFAAYVLEDGEYEIFAGTDCRSCELVGKTNLTYSVVKQVKNRCLPVKLSKRLCSDGSFTLNPTGDDYSSLLDTEKWGQNKYWRYDHIDLLKDEPKKIDFRNFPNDSSVIKLIDVAEGKNTLDEFIDQMDLFDLISLTCGCPNQGIANTSGVGDLRELGIPAAMTTDGPAGVRLSSDSGYFTTALPTATMLASTWNEDLVTQVGKAGAMEAAENNFSLWLTPALNIHRNPLCGRNFEYFSEDPYVSGVMAAAVVKGIQSVGIGACIKHFACNNKEDNRYMSDSIVSERALREIYLKGFQIAIEKSNPWSIMTSYNKINGTYSPENKDLINGILREEWGYDGMAIADWGSHAEPYREVLAGNNVHMPVSNCEHLCVAYEKGLITKEMLKENVKYILNFILKLK